VLKSLGLKDNEAFNRAVQAAKLLPVSLGPDQVKLGRTGEFVIAIDSSLNETRLHLRGEFRFIARIQTDQHQMPYNAAGPSH
jgi:hypothetical protein